MRENYAEDIDLLEQIINHENASDVSRQVHCGELAELYHFLGDNELACNYFDIKSRIQRDILLDEDPRYTKKEKEKFKQEFNNIITKADEFIQKGEFLSAYSVYAEYHKMLV